MKQYEFPQNTRDCNIVYNRTREGPNHFRIFYKNAAQIRFTPKEACRIFGVAKFTPTVNAMREWCYEMIRQYGSEQDQDNEEYQNYIAKHGFGPEVHEEPNTCDPTDPTANTKMVT